METIRNRTIRGESVLVDGKIFIDCELVDCLLEYSGGPIVFERTNLSGCRYVFFGPARGTVHFLQGVGLMAHSSQQWAEFPDLVH